MTDRTLPVGAKRTGSSPEFAADNLPAALLADHSTAAGVYGRVHVLAGELDFVFATKPDEPVRLRSGDQLIVLPEEAHHVVPGPDMRFLIEFYRDGGGASAD